MTRWLGVVLLGAVMTSPARADEKFEEELIYQGRSLRTWLTELRSTDREVRLRASRILREVGPEAHAAVPALLMHLKSDDGIVRTRVVNALVRSGPQQLPLFTAALSFDEPRIVQGTARVLAGMGADAKPAARALTRLLTSPSADARMMSAYALWQIDRRTDGVDVLRKQLGGPSMNQQWAGWVLAQLGPAAAPAAPELVTALASADDRVRSYALGALEAIGADAVLTLVKGLEHPHARARVEAAEALGRIGPAATPAIAPLVGRLKDSQPGPAVAAARALGRIGVPADEVIAGLRAALRHSDPDLRAESARALAALRPKAAAALPELSAALRDGSKRGRQAAAAALVRLGKVAVPALTELAKDDDHLVRRQALLALRDIGPDAEPALPVLRAALKEPGNALRLAAVEALGAIGAPAVEALVAALTGDREVRRAAVSALGAIGPAARDAAPELAKLGITDSAFRTDILAALEAMRPAAKDVLSLLRICLKEGGDEVRLRALAVLEGLGEDGKPAAGDDTPLQNGSLPVRRASAAWLIRMGASKYVARTADAAIHSDDPVTRAAAIHMVLLLGKDARERMPLVRASLRDEDIACRVSAALACWQMEKSSDGVATLIDLLRPQTRRTASPAAFRVLARMGPGASATVPLLAAIVQKEVELDLRLEAARTLGAIGPDAAGALPVLFALLLDVMRLRDVEGEEARDAVLTETIQDEWLRDSWSRGDADLRRSATRALAALRRDGDLAFPQLQAVLDEASTRLERDVLDAIAAIGPAAVSLARRDLAHDSAEVRRRGARILARLGPAARDATADLHRLAAAATAEVAVEAVLAVHAVAGEGGKHTEVLKQALSSSSSTAAARAARALGEVGAPAVTAAPALAAALRRREPAVRREAAWALGRLRPDGKFIRAALEERLRDTDLLVRLRAVQALGEMEADIDPVPFVVAVLRDATGRQALLEALSVLEKLAAKGKPASWLARRLCRDESEEVRLAAARALWKVSGDVAIAAQVAARVAAQGDVRPATRLAALATLAELGAEARTARAALAALVEDPATPASVVSAAKGVLAKMR
jgi:HEAT repeat protein